MNKKHGLTGKPSNASKGGFNSILNLRCSENDHEQWKAQAEKEGLKKSEWVVKTLNEACDRKPQ